MYGTLVRNSIDRVPSLCAVRRREMALPTSARRPVLHQHVVREVFLRGVGFCYFSAFASLYLQLPGLYGDDGLLPVAPYYERSAHTSWTFLMPLHEIIGLRVDEWLDVLCLGGTALAALAVAGYATFPVLALLWLQYASCFAVGQTFLSFQWDLARVACRLRHR